MRKGKEEGRGEGRGRKGAGKIDTFYLLGGRLTVNEKKKAQSWENFLLPVRLGLNSLLLSFFIIFL